MQNLLRETINNVYRKRVKRTRMLAILLVLSLVVSLDVFWILRQPGLTLAGNADCFITEHTHDESCQNPCPEIEHTHTVECYSSPEADTESQLNWQKKFENYPYTGNLAEDLVGIAKTQVGYGESELNFQVDQNGVKHGYTRYGAWYGVPYSDWSATFVAFCLNYAKADLNEYPINTGANSMAEQWKALGKFKAAGEYKPLSGDLVFFKDNTVGIIATAKTTTCYVICGDIEDKVQTKLISLTDPSVSGFGTITKRSTYNPLYDISNGPAVFVTATDTKTESEQTGATKKAQTYNLKNAKNTENIYDLVDYLNKNGGNYYFALSDTSEHAVPKDENGNFIVHAETIYKLTLTIARADGFNKGTYEYRLPEGVIIASVGGDKLIVNDNEIGSWSIDETGLVKITFNEKSNNLSDVMVSMTIGIIIPREQTEINFDGKINMTVEPPREEIEKTEVEKWGLAGGPENANNPNHATKLDESKIYWSAVIEGNQLSNIVGSVITDQIANYDSTYEYTYTESDKAAGIKFGVTIFNPETGEETWHAWTVYEGDPNLTWGTNGWSYRVPETVICNKNTNSPHELVLGNNNYTYHIDYTVTPTHVDIAGGLDYANTITVDNEGSTGWVKFSHGDVHAAIYKNGTLVTDASGAKIIWEIKATIPKKELTERAERDWTISDSMEAYTNGGTWINLADNIISISSFTANYFGTEINVPNLWVATENDPYAYDFYTWEYGAGIAIVQRCVCTPETCGEKDGVCGTWGGTAYCDCWHEIEDTTFTITYETDVTNELEEYGGLNSYVRNGVGLTSKNFEDITSTQLYVNETVPLPGIIQKEDYPREDTIVKYSIIVNEAKLNLTGGDPLVILDEMTPTLAFMRGSLVITSYDAFGNEVVLQEGVDYVYDYNNHEDIGEVHDKHVLKVTILNPQPVTYRLDYRTSLIMPTIENFQAVNYKNTASISLWNGKATDSSTERIFPDINIASNAFSVFVHKLSAEDKNLYLPGATFGLFNDQGGLITTATTGQDGKAYFETNVENGIILREHKIYYVKELTAPPGYKLDETIHEFTFCSNADGNCDVYNDLKEEHDLVRVPFEEVGHIDVTNELLSYNLPETGGIGTYPLLLVSVMFIITPLVYIFDKKRKQKGMATDNVSYFAGAKHSKNTKKERKKIMKKLVSLLLALALVFAMSIPAFAATVTIGTDANREYEGYQLMTLTTSLKCAENHTHNKDCYNYAYTVNGQEYLDVLIAAIDVADVDTAEEVIAYIDAIADNSDDMNDLAKAIYDEIALADIEGTAISGGATEELAQGYWLFADVTNIADGEHNATSFIMVKTQGQDDITITPKFGLPTVTKKVKDVNDTTGVTSDWEDSADADIGDKVDFKLTATLGDYFDSYEEYTLIFHDTFNGFVLDTESDVVVTAKNGDTVLNITGKYDVVEDADDCSFEVVFEDITAIAGVTKDTVFEVTYKGVLEGPAVRNTNGVVLEYSNDPYDNTSTGTTSDEVAVYTYNLTIDKKANSEDGAALEGAGFTLSKMVNGVKTLVSVNAAAEGKTQFVWNGLDDGEYILEETTTPDGYNTMEPLNFTITATHNETGVQTLISGDMTVDVANGAISDIIVNNSGTVLPETGGMGTMWLIFGGAVLVTLAGVFMMTRKKMSIYED